MPCQAWRIQIKFPCQDTSSGSSPRNALHLMIPPGPTPLSMSRPIYVLARRSPIGAASPDGIARRLAHRLCGEVGRWRSLRRGLPPAAAGIPLSPPKCRQAQAASQDRSGPRGERPASCRICRAAMSRGSRILRMIRAGGASPSATCVHRQSGSRRACSRSPMPSVLTTRAGPGNGVSRRRCSTRAGRSLRLAGDPLPALPRAAGWPLWPIIEMDEALWVAERVFDNYSHWFSAHLPKLVMLRDRGELANLVLPADRPPWLDESLRADRHRTGGLFANLPTPGILQARRLRAGGVRQVPPRASAARRAMRFARGRRACAIAGFSSAGGMRSGRMLIEETRRSSPCSRPPGSSWWRWRRSASASRLR